MSRLHRRSLLFAGLAWVLCCSLPGVASAQLREFTGRVVAASASKLVVESGGDELAFAPAGDVAVSGAKKSWQALAKGDRVTVSWKIGDTPRKAHRVVVQPPRGQ